MPRLPQTGSDAGSWGDILNDFLSQSHKQDGTLKDDIITEAQLAPAVVTKIDSVQPGAIGPAGPAGPRGADADLTGVVKSINGVAPDTAGDVVLAAGGGFTATAHPTFPGVFTLSGSAGQVTPDAPVVTTQPAATAAADVGSSIVISAAASGTPTPTCQWQVYAPDGSGNASQWQAITGATLATLTITGSTIGYIQTVGGAAATIARSGTWSAGVPVRAVFTNSAGAATTTESVLHDNVTPTSATSSVNGTQIVGQQVTLIPAVNAYPAATIQWQKYNTGTSAWDNISTSTNYVIASATTGDNGSYRFVATNALGSATSSSISLTFALDVPVFTGGNTGNGFYIYTPAYWAIEPGVTVVVGNPLAAAVTGATPMTFQWQISTAGQSGPYTDIVGATSQTHTFTYASPANYRCVATNAYGSATSTNGVLSIEEWAP